jgi:hypothetical protein
MAKAGGSIFRGMAIGAGLTLAGVLAFALLMIVYIGAFLLVGIGLAQAIWMLPAFRHYRGRGEAETAKGILIVAGLVAMLNTTCWGFLAASALF